MLFAVLFAAVFENSAVASVYKFRTPVSVCVDVPTRITKTDGPQLFFSDSPEFVSGCGILYRDIVSGDVRIFYDHVNVSSEDSRIGIVIRNLSDKPVSVTKKQSGIASEKDWNAMFRASKNYQAAYFASKRNMKFTLPPGISYEVISGGGNGVAMPPQMLATGMADFSFGAPVEVVCLMARADEDIANVCDTYKVLSPDNREHVMRGTFPYSDIRIEARSTLAPALGKVFAIKLGDAETGGYVKGIDATTGEAVTDYGNYGAIYTVNFRVNAGGEDKSALIMLNPLGGAVGGAGKISCNGKTDIVYIPKKGQALGEDTGDEKCLLAKVRGSADVTFTFAPSSGSFLPVNLMIYSEDEFLKETGEKNIQ